MPTVLSGPERWVQWSAFLLQSGIVWTGRSRIAAAQLLNVEGTVDRKGDQEGQHEQSERNDHWPQCDAVRLARVDGQHRHGYERRQKDCGDEWGEEG